MALVGWWLGRKAERDAARLVTDAGLTVLAANVRTKSGELDLIAREGDILVIIEVRRRAANIFAAVRSITPHKRRCLFRASHEARVRLHLPRGIPVRFDVVLFNGLGVGVHARGAITGGPTFLI